MPDPVTDTLSSFLAAPQHGPRPLPLFLDMLRNETATSPEKRATALAGLEAYQRAPRDRPRKAAPARYRKGRVRLRDYGLAGNEGRTIIFVPSLINPPGILDLNPDVSLMRWLAAQGFRPLLLDWGTPGVADQEMDLAQHVERLLLPLIARFDEPPVLAGYCLGGTIALAAACCVPVAGLALIATPWRFSGFGPVARAEIASLWDRAKPTCAALGLVPMEVLQAGFWRLDPARTIAKYESFGAMAPGGTAARSFVALEDWANAGAPMPYAAGCDMFEALFAQDVTGRGQWRIGDVRVDPAALPCPAIEFVSLTDRIVPAASAVGLAQRHDLRAGHVGMIVGRGARAQLWEPLARWLSGLPRAR